MITKRIYLQDLNANDVFTMSDTSTDTRVCERRHTDGGVTRVDYRPTGMTLRATVALPSLTCVYVVV